MPENTNKTQKQSRGLPAGFGLNVPQLGRKPVSLGDYLDEDDDVTPAAKPQPTPPPQAVGEGGATETAPAETPAVTPKPKRRRATPSLPTAAKSKYTRPGPPRKQINMHPETLDKARELLFLVQAYSPQPDAKASEVFEALVDLLYESRDHFDFSDVPFRGKWGEPSARAFPQHLKAAFTDAIVRQQQSRSRRHAA